MRVGSTVNPTSRTIVLAGFAGALLIGIAACASTGTDAGTPSSRSPTAGPPTSSPPSSSPGTGSQPSVGTVPTSAADSASGSARATSASGGAPARCLASDLAGRWTGIPGSAGMGNVSSDLALHNTSAHACTVDGYPAFTLYSAAGTALPTHVTFNTRPAPTLIVRPGGWVHSELRYSTDVPGSDESTSGPCEPSAAYALATITGSSGTVRATLDTPQPICSRGRVAAKPFASGPSSPAGG